MSTEQQKKFNNVFNEIDKIKNLVIQEVEFQNEFIVLYYICNYNLEMNAQSFSRSTHFPDFLKPQIKSQFTSTDNNNTTLLTRT